MKDFWHNKLSDFLSCIIFFTKLPNNWHPFYHCAESRFTFIKNVNFYNSLLWVHPLKIFEASYGTDTSDEIPSPMWDLILKGFKRNPTWAFEENKKKKQRRCSKHYAINLSVFEVFQFHQIFQSCSINHKFQGIKSENFFKRN